MTFRVFFGLGEFRGVQDLVACCDKRPQRLFNPGANLSERSGRSNCDWRP